MDHIIDVDKTRWVVATSALPTLSVASVQRPHLAFVCCCFSNNRLGSLEEKKTPCVENKTCLCVCLMSVLNKDAAQLFQSVAVLLTAVCLFSTESLSGNGTV